ncbi:hypothetical protein FGO68_gene2830 [Halteria grandinella]|uniref:Uncharacterized protein n=1 Tax=Halteria grandinella TaxID=5974 RepID=A0A8J8NSE2_HALGN|nr:hypothetical protein FGO68_gene2830 [Halteria grandinella]
MGRHQYYLKEKNGRQQNPYRQDHQQIERGYSGTKQSKVIGSRATVERRDIIKKKFKLNKRMNQSFQPKSSTPLRSMDFERELSNSQMQKHSARSQSENFRSPKEESKQANSKYNKGQGFNYKMMSSPCLIKSSKHPAEQIKCHQGQKVNRKKLKQLRYRKQNNQQRSDIQKSSQHIKKQAHFVAHQHYKHGIDKKVASQQNKEIQRKNYARKHRYFVLQQRRLNKIKWGMIQQEKHWQLRGRPQAPKLRSSDIIDEFNCHQLPLMVLLHRQAQQCFPHYHSYHSYDSTLSVPQHHSQLAKVSSPTLCFRSAAEESRTDSAAEEVAYRPPCHTTSCDST